MNKELSFLDFFTRQASQVPVAEFLTNLLLSALFGYLLGRFYTRYGTALSNRESFSRNFLMVTMTTMLIISIVKSSLALSLGLVGALSVIRFRAAIKEPEELSYLFLAISLGLGFGAGQTVITMLALAVILGILAVRMRVQPESIQPNLYVTISSPGPNKLSFPQIQDALRQSCAGCKLRRFDESPQTLEASFQVQFDNSTQMDALNQQLRALNPALKITYLEEHGLAV